MTRRHADMTADCDCGLVLFPTARTGDDVVYECANRHSAILPLPAEEPARRLVQNWIDRRSAQLDAQHRRWGTDDLTRR